MRPEQLVITRSSIFPKRKGKQTLPPYQPPQLVVDFSSALALTRGGESTSGLFSFDGHVPWQAASERRDGGVVLVPSDPRTVPLSSCEVLMLVGLPGEGAKRWAETPLYLVFTQVSHEKIAPFYMEPLSPTSPGTGKSTWASEYVRKNADRRYIVLGMLPVMEQMKV